MTQQEKINILENNDIEYTIHNGELLCLYKMSTFTGDDCSEWLNADDLVNHLLIGCRLHK